MSEPVKVQNFRFVQNGPLGENRFDWKCPKCGKQNEENRVESGLIHSAEVKCECGFQGHTELMPWLQTASDFEITRSVHAVFYVAADKGLIRVIFTVDGKPVPGEIYFGFDEAAQLGKQIEASGSWSSFPIDGVPIEALKAFGHRLHDYGIHRY